MTHHIRLPRLVLALVAAVVLAMGMASLALAADESVANRSSSSVTWTCTSSPCPSGPLLEGQAVEWPSAMGATTVRLGYTASRPVYAPGAAVTGWTVRVVAGSARVEAGLPQDQTHRELATLGAGGSFVVGELAQGEVVSVQASSVFMYALDAPAAPSPTSTTSTTSTTTTSTTSTTTTQAPTTTTTTQAPTTTTTTQPTTSTSTTTTTPVPTTTTTQAPERVTGSSTLQTWTCTGSPCPWGPTTTDHALAWPSSMGPVNVRLGYTVSAGVYAPGAAVRGWTVSVTSGSARIYAGLPQGSSHRLVASLTAGGSHVVGSLAQGEVLSVQNSTAFSYALVAPAPSPTPTTTTTTSTPTTTTTTSTPTTTTTTSTPTTTTATTTPVPTTTTTTPPPGVPEGSTASTLVTWTCTSSPCPWGPSTSDHAAVWPSAMGATTTRLGYTTSAAVYAPGAAVSGWTVSIPAGTAKVFAGLPQGSSHRLLATIATGGSYVVSGLSSGEVVSVQAPSGFAWALTEPVGGPTPTPTTTTPSSTTTTPTSTTTTTPSSTTTTTPTPTPTTRCTDPTTCDPVDWIESRWRCNVPGCTYGDWVGGVISWPSWAAYENNARSGASSRTVYSVDGDLLYPYMGAWASGCRVEVVSGAVLIIEWKRGSDSWRETLVEAGQSHVIQLAAGEDGAMIETPNNVEPFSVSLQNCTPQPVTK